MHLVFERQWPSQEQTGLRARRTHDPAGLDGKAIGAVPQESQEEGEAGSLSRARGGQAGRAQGRVRTPPGPARPPGDAATSTRAGLGHFPGALLH